LNIAVRPSTPEVIDMKVASTKMVADAIHSIALCGKKELTELPEILRLFKELECLDFSNTGIKCVPSWIGDLGKLKVLNLSGTQIDDLPVELNKCTGLTVLLLDCPNLVNANLRKLKIKIVNQ
jgi:Leucine-rich repeat (LRR) protein